jgi:protein-tyrosine phosphatase
MTKADAFEVVFVCTGNRARSPLAEAVFRRETTGLDAEVSSVGTLELGSVSALPDAIAAARRLGLDLEAHRSRSLRAAPLDDADLVLGFEPSNVAAAIAEGGASPNRTFLLRELVMLLDPRVDADHPVARARAVVAAADARRVPSGSYFSPALVVADPLGRPAKVMHETAAEIERLVRQLVLGLFGSSEEFA